MTSLPSDLEAHLEPLLRALPGYLQRLGFARGSSSGAVTMWGCPGAELTAWRKRARLSAERDPSVALDLLPLATRPFLERLFTIALPNFDTRDVLEGFTRDDLRRYVSTALFAASAFADLPVPKVADALLGRAAVLAKGPRP